VVARTTTRTPQLAVRHRLATGQHSDNSPASSDAHPVEEKRRSTIAPPAPALRTLVPDQMRVDHATERLTIIGDRSNTETTQPISARTVNG
jgi:hypothetical protein